MAYREGKNEFSTRNTAFFDTLYRYPYIAGKEVIIAMKNKEVYTLMFTDVPDIVDIKQMQQMLGISRHLAYELITAG